MKLYNISSDTKEFFNESGSKVIFEPTTGSIDVNEPFAAVLNDQEAFDLCKKVGTVIIFDAQPKLFIRLAQNNIKTTLLVGVQEWSEGDYLLLRTNNLLFYPLREISIDGKADVCDAVMAAVKDTMRLHVHINGSVLNETGMSARELLYFLHRLRLLKSMKSISLANVSHTIVQKLAVEFVS